MLDETGAAGSLVGELADGMRVEPRNTHGVAVHSDAEAESLVYTLTGLGYRQGTVIEQTATRRTATVRVHPPGQGPRGVVVDLLFASSGIESEVVTDAERLELIPGLEVPVACLGHLIGPEMGTQDRSRSHQTLNGVRPPKELGLPKAVVPLTEKVACSSGYQKQLAFVGLAAKPLMKFLTQPLDLEF